VTLILAVGLAWLLVATVVAMVIGRAIRLADAGSSTDWTALDRLLADGRRDLDAAQAPGAPLDRAPRTA
jgi:hypothetical protein